MNNGIIKVVSTHSFDETYNKLKQALDNNPKLTVIAELNHSNNASKVGLTLVESKIIFFGNPNLGTPLMKENIVLGLDLPQKMLVCKKDNEIIVVYNNPNYLKERHQIENNNDILNKISNALKGLADFATK